jgi:hypothetical protein
MLRHPSPEEMKRLVTALFVGETPRQDLIGEFPILADQSIRARDLWIEISRELHRLAAQQHQVGIDDGGRVDALAAAAERIVRNLSVQVMELRQ